MPFADARRVSWLFFKTVRAELAVATIIPQQFYSSAAGLSPAGIKWCGMRPPPVRLGKTGPSPATAGDWSLANFQAVFGNLTGETPVPHCGAGVPARASSGRGRTSGPF